MMDKAVILLSGGLDSYVCLDIAKKEHDIVLALTLNYGQIAFEDEKEAAAKIAEHYGIEHKIIELPFLTHIKGDTVWVPNRNGLFLNLAGCFCDAYGFKNIIFGANLEEAAEFPDNTLQYVEKTNEALFYSTRNAAYVLAPIVNMTKAQTIEYAIQNGLNFEFIKSCYGAKSDLGKKHCGVCPSCLKIKNAILKLNRPDLFEKMGF